MLTFNPMNRILYIMMVAVAALITLNVWQYYRSKDVRDAEMDAVSLERIRQAWSKVEEYQRLYENAADSIAELDSVISVLSNRRTIRTTRYDTIYYGISHIPTDARQLVLADRRDYLESLRGRRISQ